MTPTEYLEENNNELKLKLEKNLLRNKVTKEMMDFAKEYHTEQLILSGVSDIVHRAELKVLENVSDYIPCEIYSQAIIFSQKKRDNVR